MRLHSEWIGEKITRIRLTGGASNSSAIQQIIADIFQAEVEIIQVTNSAGLGSAMRAASAIENIKLKDLSTVFCKGIKVASPRLEYKDIYHGLLKEYHDFENNWDK